MKSLMRHLPLMRTCQEAASLVVAREDRRLSALDSTALRMHLFICKACPKFENQILTMRNAMKQWRNYTEDQ